MDPAHPPTRHHHLKEHMATYEDPNNKMEEAVEDVRALDCHRDRLKDVSIAVMSAHASRDEDDEPKGEALSARGRPILGMIRIMSTEDRAAGNADVRVILNGDRWGQLSAAMQRGVVDDCLTQIEVVKEEGGVTKRDEHGRPKLRRRAWDYELCGFHDVAQRHGASSVEVHNFRVLFDQYGQTYLPHFAPDERPVNYLEIAPKRTKTRAKELATGSSDGSHQRGPLAAAALVARIEHLDSPATLLAVAKLELAKKPRKPVVAGIKSRVLQLVLLQDYIRVEKGDDQHDPAVDLDLDAAVLVTSPSDLDLDVLDRFVPGCRDVTVLAWILDDEQRREDSRQEVLDVVEARLEDLGALAGRTQTVKTTATDDDSDSMGDAADAEYMH